MGRSGIAANWLIRLVCLTATVVSLAGCSASNGATSTVGIVGDSITYLSEPTIAHALRGWRYDIQAVPGRDVPQMIPLMESQIIKSPDGPPHSLVIDLGTNDVVHDNLNWAADWRTLMADTAEVPCLVLFTINTVADGDGLDSRHQRQQGSPTAQDLNRLIAAARNAGPARVHVIDWNAAVHRDGALVLPDGIHPTVLGRKWIAQHIELTLSSVCR